MKNLYLTLLIFFSINFANAQTIFVTSTGQGMTGTMTLQLSGIQNNKNYYTTPGTNGMYISWNAQNNRWEAVRYWVGGSFLWFYSNYNSSPNPPNFSTGNWQDAGSVTVLNSLDGTGTWSFTTSQTNVSCKGGTNGTASVSNITGGTAPYTYTWSPSGGTNATASGLSAGNYTCTIKDATNATYPINFTITEPAAALSATTSQTNVACNGGTNGSATVTAAGGTAPYTYSWSPSGGTGATATGLSAGTYTCTITDANNCQTTKSVTITQPTAIAVTAASQTNVTCNFSSNGAASINIPTGGAGGYTYNWTPGNPSGDGTRSVTGLTAGTWTCTVTDANGCTKTQNFTITSLSALTATQSQTNVACKGSATGSATVTASGSSGYTYYWKKGNTTLSSKTNIAADLAAGNDYTCTITDANGCSIVKSFTITEPATAFTVTQSQNNPTCWMYVNGNVSVSASGGNSPYTYLWSHNGQQYPPTYNNISQIDAEVGSYSCTVIDANGCTIVKNFQVTQPPAFDIGITKVGSTLKANSSGLAYQWSLDGINITGATSQIYTPIANGTYQCQIWKNGCDYYSNLITISNIVTIDATTTQTNVTCKGGANGSATVSPSGGTTPYTYSWSPSGGTSATATGLAAGSYTVTVTDVNNNSIQKTVTITEPATVLAATQSQNNVSCKGGSNGSATVTASGGASGYTYVWKKGITTLSSTTNTAASLSAGNDYTCTITDANGCTITKNFTITEPAAALTATQSQTNVSCKGGSNGSATVTASGTSGYTYVWKKGTTTLSSTANNATGLAAGNDYTCTITDANGCSLVKNFTITEPATALAATQSQTNPTCWDYANGSIRVDATGGTAPYKYYWSYNGQLFSSVFENLNEIEAAAGNYSCTIKDANNCSIVKNFIVTQPAAFDIGISQVAKTLQANTAGLAYQWILDGNNINGATNQVYTPTSNGMYQCQIWKNGCDYYSNLITISNLATQEVSMASKVKIYPNPVKDVLTIDATKLTNATVEIYDLNGRIIQKNKIITNVNNINVSKLVRGNYLVKIVSKEGTQTIKLIKE